MQERPHLGYVDGLRAIAVLSVLVFHGFLGDGQTLPQRVLCYSRGVDLFFVISGFCLAFPFLARPGRLKLDKAIYGRFLLRRLSRIAPPYYVALCAFAILGMTAFGFPSADHPAAGLGFSVHAAREFLADAVFLIPRVPLHNIAFWTLGIEARWYLLCPLLIALYVRSKWSFFGLAGILYGVYFFTPYGVADMGTLPCFMAGIVAADVVLRRQAWRRYAWIAAAAALGLGIWTSSGDHGDPIWHLAGFFLVVGGSVGPLNRILRWKPLLATGVCSYSIYLYHAPFVIWFEHNGVVPPLALAWALCIGFVAWALAERHLADDQFRRNLESRLAAPFQPARPQTTAPEAA